MSPRRPPGTGRARWTTDLALGARMSVAGGAPGWARLVMIGTGVALGVVMLLATASIPTAVAARDARTDARTPAWAAEVSPGAATLLATPITSGFEGTTIHGLLVQPEGGTPVTPPGVDVLPGVGETVVSPALADLMASDEGAVLRDRWGGQVVGQVAPDGLAGPDELYVYVGTDRLTEESGSRIDAFGSLYRDDGLPPLLVVLALVGLAALLLPVAVFVATAVRFGGEARDRRLAAVRLVGADTSTTRRIAAGETLTGALLGLVLGAAVFLGARLVVARTWPSFYLSDLRPVPALVVLVVVLVPACAVLVTFSALRRVVVEPLGVVRQGAAPRRRLWWRLLLPASGVALLATSLSDGLSGRVPGAEYRVVAGVAALLVGVALLLPWLTQATVRRLGPGPVGWDLAVRRLQLDDGTSVRAVSGIAVSVAGVIAVQGLLAAVTSEYTLDSGASRSSDVFQVTVSPSLELPGTDWTEVVEGSAAVVATSRLTTTAATWEAEGADVVLEVADCAVLSERVHTEQCSEGDVFVVAPGSAAAPQAGDAFAVGRTGLGALQAWSLPSTASAVESRDAVLAMSGSVTVLATPSALGDVELTTGWSRYYVALDPSVPGALETLRTDVGRVDPAALVSSLDDSSFEATLVGVRQALLGGAVALLLLVGASMLVNVGEQLRERRQLLAVLSALGTPRRTLAASVLWQVAVPVTLGMVVAVVTGAGLAVVLQSAAGTPVSLDWSGAGATSGAAVLVVLLTTAASLPLLWRLSSAERLRSE